MSEESQAAAAGVLEDLAAEFVDEGTPAEGETPAGSQEETVAEAETQQETVEEVPEDVLALINEPDFEEEAEAEIQAEVPEDEYNVDEYTEPELATERKKRLAAEKKAAWLEQRIVADNSKKWLGEAERYFPYADLDSIKPESRRQVLREASAQHERIKVQVEKALAHRSKELEAQAESERGEIKEQQKAAWGSPLAGPGGPPPSSTEKVQRAKAVNAGRGLRDTIRARLDAGTVNLGMSEGGETNE